MMFSVRRHDKGIIYRDKGRNIWWIKYYIRGHMQRESSHSRDQDDAMRLLKIREGEAARRNSVVPQDHRIKFSALQETIHLDYLLNKRKTWRDTECRLRRHILPVLGHLEASRVSELDVEMFVRKRIKEGVSNGELNRELYVINHMFKLAIKRKILSAMPDVTQFKAEEDNIRTGFFEEPEFRELLKFLPADIHPVVRFAYITGWRIPSMVLPLKWSSVNFAAEIVRLEPGIAKNKKGINFPFTDGLRRLLYLQKSITETIERGKKLTIPWIFHREGRRIKYFRRSWLTACKRVKLDGRIPHDFRRTAVRNLVRAGVPRSVAKYLTGHKTDSVFERYDITSESDLKDAAEKLNAAGNILGNKKKTKKRRKR